MLYRSLLRRLLFRLPPETAHELALHFLANDFGLTRLAAGSSPQPFGELQRFGLKFSNPVGLAAGFDKDGIALNGLAAALCLCSMSIWVDQFGLTHLLRCFL